MVAFLYALPGDDDAASPAFADEVPPRWFAFRIKLPDAAARAAPWRAQRALDAVNVQRGLWAVRGDPGHRRRLDELAALAAASGGHTTVKEVGSTAADDIVLGSRLHRACERLWETFATQADWYVSRLGRRDGDLTERVAALTGLYDQFGSIVGIDIARSYASRHAETRLQRLAGDLIEDAGLDPQRWCREERRPHRRVGEPSSFPLADGRRVHVARVLKTADPVWAAAFAQFESFAYQPSPDRVPLRAGVFRWVAPAGAEREMLPAMGARVERFEASLA
jgi:hypothetical protein